MHLISFNISSKYLVFIKFYIILNIIFLIYSCKIKVNKIKELPLQNSLTINLENIVDNDSIQRIYIPHSLDIDEKGHIYILDYKKRKIFCFKENGEYFFSFGNKGYGPGEMLMPDEVLIKADSVFVTDAKGRKMHHFTTSGQFIKAYNFQEGIPRRLQLIDNKTYIAYLMNCSKGPKKYKLSNYLSIINQYGVTKKRITGITKTSKKDYLKYYDKDIFIPYAFESKTGILYLAENSKNDYIINAVSIDDNRQLFTIKNNHKKILYSEKEKKGVMSYFFGNRESYLKELDNKSELNYKNSISEMFIDKNSNLWVKAPSNNNSYIFYIYKNGNLFAKCNSRVLAEADRIVFKNKLIYALYQEDHKLIIFEYL